MTAVIAPFCQREKVIDPSVGYSSRTACRFFIATEGDLPDVCAPNTAETRGRRAECVFGFSSASRTIS
jgi:hypothetical protein